MHLLAYISVISGLLKLAVVPVTADNREHVESQLISQCGTCQDVMLVMLKYDPFPYHEKTCMCMSHDFDGIFDAGPFAIDTIHVVVMRQAIYAECDAVTVTQHIS